MAIGTASALRYSFYLQITSILELIAPGEGIRVPANWAHSERVSGTNPERSERVPCAGFHIRAETEESEPPPFMVSRLARMCEPWGRVGSSA